MKNLVIRSISGIIYSALIVSAALYSDLSYIILIFIFSSFTLYEFQKLIEYKSPVPFILFSIIIYQFYNQKLLKKHRTPPPNIPSHVFFGEIEGKRFFLPISLPIT